MNKPAILDWLWHYRKLLLLGLGLLLLLELLYFIPNLLSWWILIIFSLVTIFSWWIGNLAFSKATWLFMGELLWVILGGIGFLSLSLLPMLWQAQLVIFVIVIISWLIAYWHQNHIDYNQWSLVAINWLGLIDLVALFVATIALLLAVQFYSLGVFWLVAGVALQLVLALYLLFWRRGLSLKKFWLYALVLALLGQQLVWITYAWHKSIYFKAFLLLIMYYLYSDFVAYYLKGNLTIKIIWEYIAIAVFLVLVLFFFDFIFLFLSDI